MKNSLAKDTTYLYGLNAEQHTIKYLTGLGWQIIAHRYKTRYGETDIIALDGEVLVFIEVKARKQVNENYALVGPRQIQRNCQAASHFIAQHREYENYKMRFDFLSICDGQIISHLQNAWEFVGSES
jgi:putative endonuclease